MLSKVTNHLRNRDYMSGVERDRSRVKSTGEVFTPTPLVQEILQQLPQEQFTDSSKTFLDPSCGDGQFLSEVIIRKMESGSTYEQALNTTYGVDLMPDNCRECVRRLYMADDTQIEELGKDTVDERASGYQWSDGLRAVYWVNTPHWQGIARIVCADGLRYEYNFGEPTSVGAAEPGLFEFSD